MKAIGQLHPNDLWRNSNSRLLTIPGAVTSPDIRVGSLGQTDMPLAYR